MDMTHVWNNSRCRLAPTTTTPYNYCIQCWYIMPLNTWHSKYFRQANSGHISLTCMKWRSSTCRRLAFIKQIWILFTWGVLSSILFVYGGRNVRCSALYTTRKSYLQNFINLFADQIWSNDSFGITRHKSVYQHY